MYIYIHRYIRISTTGDAESLKTLLGLEIDMLPFSFPPVIKVTVNQHTEYMHV